MDFIIVAFAIVFVFIVLKVLKSALRLFLTFAVIAYVVYYLDQRQYIDLDSMLQQVGLVYNAASAFVASLW